MTSSPTHYALVNAGSDPLSIIPQDDDWVTTTRGDPRHELTRLYQHYAELYPNPRLVEEYRLKNTLLQATSAAVNAQSVSKRSTRGGGFFARLFGSGAGAGAPVNVVTKKETQETPVPSDAPLVYTDIPNEQDDGSLCGTLQSLDQACIPLEAYSVARFHLTSQRTRGDHPNAVRWGPLLGRATPTSLIVVGLGLLAELQPNKPSTIRATSDRTALLDYCHHHPGEFRLEYVRACGISPNCLAISWGFQDGLIAIYRRIQWQNEKTADMECGWEQMWMVGPSNVVLEATGDLFHDDESHPGSPLLRVADLLPLRVTTGDRRQPMVSTLAVARLGGFLELLPVPTDLWFGPILTPENHRRPKEPKRKKGQHYAIGKSIGSPAISLTTADHQLDILSMDALRTTVGLETEWNNQAFPDAPPSEYIVAVSGHSTQSPGHECISFWSVCTLFSESETETAPIGFELHSILLETTMLSSGAEVSVFATPAILQYWRMPRHVALRPDAAITDDNKAETKEEWNGRVTTISTPAPIVSMQFLDQKGSAFLAVVDWNGGTTLYDCAPMERTVSQSLSWEELARLELNQDESSAMPPMHRIIVSRTHFANVIGRRNQVGALQWLKPNPGEEHTNHFQNFYPLVILLRGEKKLLVVTFSFQDDNGQTIEPKGSAISLPFPGHGATMGDLGAGNLLFVYKQLQNQGTTFFKLVVMQNLQPTAIVESLAREQKYEEAVTTARNLDALDQATLAEVVEECHRRLWETNRDIDSLADTRNITYIVDQAQTVCQSVQVDDDLTFEKLRLVCQLAMTMGRNHRPVKDALNQISAFLIRLGTYELLCKHFSTPMILSKFRLDFQSALMVDIAKSIAKRGDTSALAIVLFRHRVELFNELFNIFADIPLSVHPKNFVHLLPLVKDGCLTDTYMPTMSNDIAPLHVSHMPQHVKDTEGTAIVIDTTDEKLVLQHNLNIGMMSDKDTLTMKASRWFIERSTNVQHFTGNIDIVVALCEIGLRCNGHDVGNSKLPPHELQSLYKTWRSATSLQTILLDDYLSLAGSEESKDSTSIIFSMNDLLSMELPELVDLILRGESNCVKILSRFNDYLQPLLLELSGEELESAGQRFDSALVSYCSGLADETFTLSQNGSNHEGVQKLAMRTVGTSAAIATSSRSSTRKHDRLIKDIRSLIQLVLGVVNKVTLALERIELDASASKELIDTIWIMYEALPDQVPSSMEFSEDYVPMLEELDDLFVDLICADVLSRWPGSAPFSFLAKRRQNKNTALSDVVMEIILKLCKSFVASIYRLKTRDKTSKSLNDLLSDIEQVTKSCYQNSLNLPALLCTHLVRPLLRQEQYHLVIEYCNSAPSLVDKETVKNAVLAYMDEAVFSDDEDVNHVMSVMKCQDIFGPVFPDIQPGFLSIRRFLDAAHFISTVIFEGRVLRPIRPAELRKQLPLDVLESIIQDVPQSIICGCRQWQDAVYAKSANATLRISASRNRPDFEVTNEMPVLPGGAVFHLATILGLQDDNAAVVVKSRVIHYAVSVGLHGAASAICRTMIGTEVLEDFNKAAASVILGAVAEIVSDENYDDLATKQELCQSALMKYSGQLDVLGSSAFDAICAASSNLDHQTSRHSRERHKIEAQRRDQLMARPYSRLQRQIHTEYNADMHGLFADLIIQTSNGLVHDSLMNALSRFVIYWCVSDAKTLRHKLVISEKNDAKENLALGCSLILQIPSNLTATTCVHELQKIVADQAANVSGEERFGYEDDICIPDPQIVGRMIGRGYTENAARRAVIMTRNTGYNEALGWAVRHTLDPDFNAPIMIIRNPRRTFIDEDAIQSLQKNLYSLHCWIEDHNARESLISFLSAMHGTPIHGAGSPLVIASINEANSVTSKKLHGIKLAHKKAARNVVAKQEDRQTSNPLRKDSASFAPSTTKFEPKVVTATRIEDTPSSPKHILAEPSVPATSTSGRPLEEQSGTTVIPSKVVAPSKTMIKSSVPLTSQVPHSNTLLSVESNEPVPVATIRETVVSASTRPTKDSRSALLKRGQMALTKVRSQSEASDRQRLIAEGRELLRKARTAKVEGGSESMVDKNGSTTSSRSTAQSSTAPIPAVVPPIHTPSTNQNGAIKAADSMDDNNSQGSGWDFDNFDDM